MEISWVGKDNSQTNVKHITHELVVMYVDMYVHANFNYLSGKRAYLLERRVGTVYV